MLKTSGQRALFVVIVGLLGIVFGMPLLDSQNYLDGVWLLIKMIGIFIIAIVSYITVAVWISEGKD